MPPLVAVTVNQGGKKVHSESSCIKPLGWVQVVPKNCLVREGRPLVMVAPSTLHRNELSLLVYTMFGVKKYEVFRNHAQRHGQLKCRFR